MRQALMHLLKKNKDYYLKNLPDKITAIALRQSAIITFFANPMITDAHWYSKDVYNNSVHMNSLVGLKGIENVLKRYSNYSPSSSIDTCNNYSSAYSVHCSSTHNTDKVNAFALISDDKNFATIYLLNHTANYLNTTKIQNDTTFQPNNYYPEHYHDAGIVTTTINGFKPFRDYIVNFYNPSTGRIINSTEIVLTTDQSGQLAISEPLIPFDPNTEQGGDLLISIEVCSNYYSQTRTCGYDEVFINYFMPKLMNSRSWDINGNDIYFIDNNGNLNSYIKTNGSYVISNVGSIQNVHPNSQLQIGQSNVFFVGTDHNIYLMSKSGGPIYPVTNGSYVDTSTHFAYNPNNHKLFFIGSDGLIYNSYYNGYAWITNKLTANAMQAKTGSEIIFNGSGKVYFIGKDSRIHEYYWSPTQNKWFEQITSQNSSIIHGGQFGFTPGNLSYFNSNGNLTVLKWQNNSWVEYPGPIPNTPDLSSDLEISGGMIYYLSDGKLQSFSLIDMEYEMELDFCAVRGDLNGKLKIENSIPFITNIDERLSTYNYLGACKTNINFDFHNNSENNSSFSIYPNPSTNRTFLLKTHDIPYTHISIVNSLGEVLIRDVYNSAHEYRVNEMKAGIYFVWIYNQDKVVDVAKLIITE
ncbi:MAG: T9SS type A sorting domain-containing protein [Schleiferiaceae bacterium]|nr:T9SS type A sorting domain-containing protein [Schleiferiaceae bacterium]